MSYTGECNGCGCCCRGFLLVGLPGAQVRKEFRCRNLVVAAGRQIGSPLLATPATRCRIHDKLYPGMPIELESADGDLATSTCIPDYPRPQSDVARKYSVFRCPVCRAGAATIDSDTPQCLNGCGAMTPNGYAYMSDSRWPKMPPDAIPPECSYRWVPTPEVIGNETNIQADIQPQWRPDYLPVEQLCNTSVLCPLEHRCVVCTGPALTAGHARRVTCPAIVVRCTACQAAKRLPDPAKYAGWWEVDTAENMSGRTFDGRAVFFEVM